VLGHLPPIAPAFPSRRRGVLDARCASIIRARTSLSVSGVVVVVVAR
jgi:hypothetical protein